MRHIAKLLALVLAASSTTGCAAAAQSAVGLLGNKQPTHKADVIIINGNGQPPDAVVAKGPARQSDGKTTRLLVMGVGGALSGALVGGCLVSDCTDPGRKTARNAAVGAGVGVITGLLVHTLAD